MSQCTTPKTPMTVMRENAMMEWLMAQVMNFSRGPLTVDEINAAREHCGLGPMRTTDAT